MQGNIVFIMILQNVILPSLFEIIYAEFLSKTKTCLDKTEMYIVTTGC